jgi:hypothetical protein
MNCVKRPGELGRGGSIPFLLSIKAVISLKHLLAIVAAAGRFSHYFIISRFSDGKIVPKGTYIAISKRLGNRFDKFIAFLNSLADNKQRVARLAAYCDLAASSGRKKYTLFQ